MNQVLFMATKNISAFPTISYGLNDLNLKINLFLVVTMGEKFKQQETNRSTGTTASCRYRQKFPQTRHCRWKLAFWMNVWNTPSDVSTIYSDEARRNSFLSSPFPTIAIKKTKEENGPEMSFLKKGGVSQHICGEHCGQELPRELSIPRPSRERMLCRAKQ